MSSRRASLIVPLLVSLAFATSAPSARAQPVDDASATTKRNAAVELGRLGTELMEAGKYAEAYEQFKAAERLVHSPVFVLEMARCKRRLGRLMSARGLYQQAAGERLAPAAPEAWRRAKQDASAELREVDTIIPKLRVVLDGPPLAEVELWIDGKPIAPAQRSAPLPVDPGDHVVAVRGRYGTQDQRRVVVETASGVSEVRLRLPRIGGAAQPQAPGAPITPVQPVTQPAYVNKGARRGAIALMTLGSVSAALGIATGIAAIALSNSLDENCGNDPCHPAFESDVDAFHGTGNTASVTLPLGAALLGTGLIVWFTAGQPQEAVSVSFGPGALTVVGSF